MSLALDASLAYTSVYHTLRRSALVIALIGLAAGVMVAIGWTLQDPRLSSLIPGFDAVRMSTGLTFALLSVCVLLFWPERLERRRLRITRVYALLICCIGLLGAAQYATGRYLGLDAFLYWDEDRMAPMSTVCFMLSGAAVMLLSAPGRRAHRWGHGLLACTLWLALLAFCGYKYGSDMTVGASYYLRMSPQAAVLFMMLSLALLCVRPSTGLMSILVVSGPGALMACHLLPAAVLLPVVLGYASLAGFNLGLYDGEFRLAFIVLASSVIFTVLIWRNARALEAVEEVRRRAENEVHQLNEELEERVSQRTAELEAANQELEAFSYSVSHDLRTPLRSIDGYSQALLEDFDARLDDEGRSHLRRVRAATQRMARLIDDMLGLAHVTRSEMRREAVDFSALARAIVADLERRDSTRPKTRVVIQEDLLAEGDAPLLQAVLENLIGNAWKFTGKTDAPYIEIGALAGSSPIVYYVRDNGAGFDMDYVGKLFRPFSRLHSDFEGTGIGLATVQRIVQRHGGAIWAESAVNCGSVFYFTLSKEVKSPCLASEVSALPE